jgi:hypothetical protein
MGISTHIYGYLGAKLPWSNELCQTFEEYFEQDRDHELPSHVFDYMGGRYHVLGVKLYDSGDFRYGMEDGDHTKILDVAQFGEMEKVYKAKFVQQFPQFSHLMDQPFCLIMFAHHS